jgi:mono/diheme cytochrome c family protein
LKTKQLAVAIWTFALTTAFAQTPPPSTLPADPLYKQNCAKCHGDTAEGRHFRGPSLTSEKAATASAEELHNIIANGRGHMPKFSGKLKAEEIDVLVQEIRTPKKD